MGKKIAIIAVIVLIGFAALAMGIRRGRMLGGAGSNLSLAAVSTDGKQIPPSAEIEAATGSLAENAAAQKVGEMIVVLSINPYPATMRQPTSFDVTLIGANGAAVDDAEIQLDMTMPQMWMPANRPALEFVGGGQYHATGQFTMRGWWRIEVIITRGGQTQSAFFDVGL